MRSPGGSRTLAVIGAFSALIAVGTILSIPLPPPVFELTWSPPIYFALAILVDSATAFDATVIGSFLGEAFNVAFRGAGSPIYPFGMVWARGPEIFIVAWAKRKGTGPLALAMIGATVFETLAFFFSDWAFYAYGLFSYSVLPGQTPLGLAAFDFGTLADLVYIPVAIVLIKNARPAFQRLGFIQG
jgi:hypothetical protein